MTSTPEEILFAFPLSFLESRGNRVAPIQEDGDEILLPRRIWEEWADLYVAGRPMLVELTNLESGHTRIACGGGQFHLETNNNVYVPNWILQHMEISETEAMVVVRPVLQELPKATLIVLKPLDDALYHSDMRELFENRLYTFHVLQTGTVLTVPVPELGMYEAYARVERLEPAATVVLGPEVNVEFVAQEENEKGVAEEAVAPATDETKAPASAGAGAGAGAGASASTEEPSAEERMTRVRAAWLERMRGSGNT
jgi:hypothetical protein